jgi:hypothetical protein
VSQAAAVRTGRLIAERQMSSALRYFTPGPPVTDPVTGQVTSSEQGAARSRCKVRPTSPRDFPAQAGGDQVFASNYIVSLPFGQAPVPAVGQEIVVESSPDPALVGARMQIRHVSIGDAITARRLLCFKVD